MIYRNNGSQFIPLCCRSDASGNTDWHNVEMHVWILLHKWCSLLFTRSRFLLPFCSFHQQFQIYSCFAVEGQLEMQPDVTSLHMGDLPGQVSPLGCSVKCCNPAVFVMSDENDDVRLDWDIYRAPVLWRLTTLTTDSVTFQAPSHLQNGSNYDQTYNIFTHGCVLGHHRNP